MLFILDWALGKTGFLKACLTQRVPRKTKVLGKKWKLLLKDLKIDSFWLFSFLTDGSHSAATSCCRRPCWGGETINRERLSNWSPRWHRKLIFYFQSCFFGEDIFPNLPVQGSPSLQVLEAHLILCIVGLAARRLLSLGQTPDWMER